MLELEAIKNLLLVYEVLQKLPVTNTTRIISAIIVDIFLKRRWQQNVEE